MLQIKKTTSCGLFVYGGVDEAHLGLLAVRKLSFALFLLREIVTHYSLLTGTAFRSLTFTSALPKSAELTKAALTTGIQPGVYLGHLNCN